MVKLEEELETLRDITDLSNDEVCLRIIRGLETHLGVLKSLLKEDEAE